MRAGSTADAEAVADDRIGGRAAPLAQDAALPSEPHDVVDGQEITGIVEPLDQPQLVLDQIVNLVQDTFRKPLCSPFPGQLDEVLLRAPPVRDHLLRIFVAQLVETEPAALGDFKAALDGVLMPAKKPRHLLRRLQMALGIGGETVTGLSDRAAFADAG